MASLFFKRKRRRRRRRPDGRMHQLTDAGLRLLALNDYDAISMARFAREAGCSVGTLYTRFSDKESFLYQTVASEFRTLSDRARLSIDNGNWRGRSLAFVVSQIVDHLVTNMSSPRAAGAIRAVSKLGTVASKCGYAAMTWAVVSPT